MSITTPISATSSAPFSAQTSTPDISASATSTCSTSAAPMNTAPRPRPKRNRRNSPRDKSPTSITNCTRTSTNGLTFLSTLSDAPAPRIRPKSFRIFWDVYNNGFIAEDSITQLYCEKVCHRFLADRYVHGTCPHCAYDDARGDQCDSCGRMLNPSELICPRCSTCENTPVSRQTTHLFLDLPKIEPRLKQWVQDASVAGKWTPNALAMTQNWLRDGLRQRCITRDLKWGVPVPLESFKDKVFYVWFDAPIGYLSITKGLCGDGWRKWWTPAPEDGYDVELVQFMGKDNVPFHTIVFPGSLLATNNNWTKLHHISTTDYLNYESGKFSMSRGVGVFGNDAIGTGIPSEVWRYYLLLNRPEGSDSVFTWDDLAVKNNDELINTLGNYINRTVTFLHKFFNAEVPELLEDDPGNVEFTEKINVELNEYIELLEKVSLKAALKKAMAVVASGNQYLQPKAPWKLLKENNKRAAGSSLAFSANLVLLVAVLLEPFQGTKFSSKGLLSTWSGAHAGCKQHHSGQL